MSESKRHNQIHPSLVRLLACHTGQENDSDRFGSVTGWWPCLYEELVASFSTSSSQVEAPSTAVVFG
ncbi:hypothetical protein L484_018229 [Morus notabilis]|uniref:Uncharacterized protein n=1 Tax=Morus notabilis TaxID=981085 RepID=W9QFL3_9ROSA|nr:hypothetical protein L484_018229 [Morus notabilis]